MPLHPTTPAFRTPPALASLRGLRAVGSRAGGEPPTIHRSVPSSKAPGQQQPAAAATRCLSGAPPPVAIRRLPVARGIRDPGLGPARRAGGSPCALSQPRSARGGVHGPCGWGPRASPARGLAPPWRPARRRKPRGERNRSRGNHHPTLWPNWAHLDGMSETDIDCVSSTALDRDSSGYSLLMRLSIEGITAICCQEFRLSTGLSARPLSMCLRAELYTRWLPALRPEACICHLPEAAAQVERVCCSPDRL